MATVCNRDTHPDFKLFELTEMWEEVIYLEDGEFPEDLGWRPTGKFGTPGRGRAMLMEDRRTIYVHGPDKGREQDSFPPSDFRYEILEPIPYQNRTHYK